ncbi:MAG: hypothetical protein ACJ8GV_08175 [Luteimonas sp.]
MVPRSASRIKGLAIALGVVAWLLPALAQMWMWLRYASGTSSLGMLWMVMTFGSLLPACALSTLGAWLWHRANSAAGMRPRARRIGFAVIATPACIVALLGIYVVASIVIEGLKIPAAPDSRHAASMTALHRHAHRPTPQCKTAAAANAATAVGFHLVRAI